MNRSAPLIYVVGIAAIAAGSASGRDEPSTSDLNFLLGEWKVERVYQPGTDNERSSTGSLACQKALQDAYVRCTYFFDRPDRGPIHDDVYFNYNPIYEQYESVWLSATWPIKVTMRADVTDFEDRIFNWESSFLIEDGVTEWVRSAWTLNSDGGFSRRTDIRTSLEPDDQWLHWMDEKVFHE